MTQRELYNSLRSTGYPVAYLEFDINDEPKLPYIVYFGIGKDKVLADDTIYAKFLNFRVELYSNKKNPIAEEVLEDALENAGIIYKGPDELYIDEEKMYEVIYEIQI